MTDPLIVLLLLAGHEASDPAMTATVRGALGTEASIVVDEQPLALSDSEALTRARRIRADAIAELRWSAAHDRVVIHLHVETIERWLDQEIAFEPVDAPHERGRTLGFALAAMISRWREQQLEAILPPARDTPKAPARLNTVPTRAALTLELRELTPGNERRFAVDALGAGGVGIGGPDLGVGGAVAFRWLPGRYVGISARGGARFGRVPSADASARILLLGGGLVLRPFGPAERGFEWTLRANLLALDHGITRPTVVSPGTTERSRWLTATDLSAEAAWYFDDTFGVVASVGAEIAFGTTDVLVGSERVTTLPLTRVTSEVGLRLRF